MRKNKTDQRASLGNCTLEALLVLNGPGTALDEGRVLSGETLDGLKGAYYRCLKGQQEEN